MKTESLEYCKVQFDQRNKTQQSLNSFFFYFNLFAAIKLKSQIQRNEYLQTSDYISKVS